MVYQGEQSGSIIIKGRVVDTYLHKNLFTTVDHENGSIDSTEIAAIVDKLEDLI